MKKEGSWLDLTTLTSLGAGVGIRSFGRQGFHMEAERQGEGRGDSGKDAKEGFIGLRIG
jgi:hypothetical protein